MDTWFENVYTWLSRVGDFFDYLYESVVAGASYLYNSIDAVLSAPVPASVAGALALAVSVCIVLLILGR